MAPVTLEAPKLDKHGFLFGLKIQASMSPLLHKTIYQELGMNWEQQLFESADISKFLELIKDPSFYGSSHLYPLELYTELPLTPQIRRLSHNA